MASDPPNDPPVDGTAVVEAPVEPEPVVAPVAGIDVAAALVEIDARVAAAAAHAAITGEPIAEATEVVEAPPAEPPEPVSPAKEWAAAVALIDGTSPVEVVWVEEPGSNLWSFEREGSSVRVSVTHDEHLYPRKDAEPGAELFDARCEVDALGRAVATGACEVLENVGVDGYLSRWKSHPFPLERLLLLEDALRR